MKRKMYLVDVSSMIFRAFYSIRSLTNPSGLPVNAIYGFLSMIIKLLKDEKPNYLIFCYDRKEPSFRKELYPEYKANRTEMPSELAQQMPYIMKLAPMLGIPALEIPNYEADDIIGSMVKIGLQHDLEVTIVSGDKDFGQLISTGVTMLDTMKDIRYDEAKVFEKWGVKPEQFIDYLAIVGDTSDNIPGVNGVGPKGAIKLLQTFGTLENIYANVDEVEGKSTKEKLLTCKEQAYVAKKLVTIATDIPLPQDLCQYECKGFDVPVLQAFLAEMNFKTFEKVLLGGGINHFASLSINTNTMPLSAPISELESSTKVDSRGLIFNDSQYILFDLDLQDFLKKYPDEKEIYGLLFNEQIYFGKELEIIRIKEINPFSLKQLETASIMWRGFDLKSFWHALGLQEGRAQFDSQLAAYVLKSQEMSDFMEVYQLFFGELMFVQSTPQEIYTAHLKLESYLRKELEGKVRDLEILKNLELPLETVLLKMEKKGVLVDREYLGIQSDELKIELKNLEAEIQQLAGETFNVASPKQLSQILFTKLQLPVIKKTKTGISTDNEVLEKLEHPIAKLVLQYREVAKIKSTYVDALPQLINLQTGRIHTHFNQAVTTTGRLSSTNPNLQNIPIRTEKGRRVRQAFIAAPDKRLLSLDYSQIELRILAHYSSDPGLCRAFQEDLDVHAATAAEVFGVSLSEITSEQRRAAKAVNFGLAYGQGAHGLAENLGISRKDAQGIIDRYFERFSGVREYIASMVQFANEKGYVETLFGRKRFIPELRSTNNMLKKFGERAAINAPIQGSASDIVKKAMIEIDQKIPLDIVLQVHDELVFEGSEVDLHQYLPNIQKIMETVITLKVPLKVNFAIGRNWDEAH